MIGWARKYGLRIYLDLHTVPGSQNGTWCLLVMICSALRYHSFAAFLSPFIHKLSCSSLSALFFFLWWTTELTESFHASFARLPVPTLTAISYNRHHILSYTHRPIHPPRLRPWTMPGTGYNHSGKFGQVNFMNGIMGIANAQRTLEYIRVITEFIAQDEYKDVVPVFGIVNEALVATIGREEITTL